MFQARAALHNHAINSLKSFSKVWVSLISHNSFIISSPVQTTLHFVKNLSSLTTAAAAFDGSSDFQNPNWSESSSSYNNPDVFYGQNHGFDSKQGSGINFSSASRLSNGNLAAQSPRFYRYGDSGRVDGRNDFKENPDGKKDENLDDHFRNNIGMLISSNYIRANVNSSSSMAFKPVSSGLAGDSLNEQSLSGGTEGPQASSNSKILGTVEELEDFCKKGKLREAVEVLRLLDQRQIPVNMPLYFLLMNECGEAKRLEEAKYVHEHLVKSVSGLEVSIYNKILEMYCKCGSMDDACSVFDRMPQRNLTSWDTMITWLAKNGLGEDALDMFAEFKRIGLKPDSEMFFGVFAACSVVGDTNEGMLHFESMSKDFGIVPSMKHYAGVVDMFGSMGYLDEALEFIEKMPMEPGVEVWATLMNQSRVHGNTELGDRCAELVEILDPSHLDEQSKAGLMPTKDSDLKREKERKYSSELNPLAVKSRMHEYRAGDTSDPETPLLYALLRGLKQQMKEVGYVPEIKYVLHDVDEESREEAILAHSEKLAVARGLLNTPPRQVVRIMKNLRFCGDCHAALKIISTIVGRELIIRDAKRFHHFKDGVCSCRDYW